MSLFILAVFEVKYTGAWWGGSNGEGGDGVEWFFIFKFFLNIVTGYYYYET